MADATVTETTTTEPPATESADYYKAEAKKAFDARQRAKAEADAAMEKLKAFDGVDPEEYKRLKADAAKAEEARKRKEGEFDQWRADIGKKHDEALTAERTRAEQAESRYKAKLVGLEFASASSLFGEGGKTVLTSDIAEAYFGKFVEVQEIDGRDVVVVKGHDGHVILDVKTGKPASFLDAMTEVIESLPNKKHILRGSGKTGSGSSGGNTGLERGQTIDPANLTPEQRRDPKVLELLKASIPRGGMVMGRAYDQ
jgi:hypothetical protein